VSLGKKAIKETTFLTLLNNGVFGLRLLSQIVLARLLLPEIFGMVVLATTVLEFVSLLGRWGVDAAVVQEKEGDKHLADNIFTLTAIYCLILLLALPLLLLGLSQFFSLSETRVFLILFFPKLLSLMSTVPRAVMVRELSLKKMGIIDLGGIFLASGLGIAAARAGWGLWALVIFQSLVLGLPAVGIFIVSSYQPRLKWQWNTIRWFFSFGRKIFYSSILTQTINQGDYIVVGTLLGSASLGIYSMAWKLTRIFQALLMMPINRVILATFSRDRISIENKAKAFDFILRNMFRIVVPFAALQVLLAGEIVDVLFGPNWAESAPLIVLSFPWSLASPFIAFNKHIHLAMGLPQNLLNAVKIQALIFILLIIPLVYLYGNPGAVITLNIVQLAGASVIYHKTRGILPTRLLRNLLPIFLAAGPAAALTGWIGCQLPPVSAIAVICIEIVIFLAIYIVVLLLLGKQQIRSDFLKYKEAFI
jgi:O-antigen/teichoic acid export membrane protein